MKETLLLGVVAFLIATGVGTWFGAYVAPPRTDYPVPAAGRDAAVGAGGKPQTTKRGAEAAASKPATAPSPSSAKPEHAAAKGPEQAGAAAATVLPVNLQTSSPAKDPKAAKEVGKILVNMKPVQAAKILEKLTDDDIEAIIRQLNPKQVAPLFVALPSERAVSMSRRLLRNATKKEGRS